MVISGSVMTVGGSGSSGSSCLGGGGTLLGSGLTVGGSGSSGPCLEGGAVLGSGLAGLIGGGGGGGGSVFSSASGLVVLLGSEMTMDWDGVSIVSTGPCLDEGAAWYRINRSEAKTRQQTTIWTRPNFLLLLPMVDGV